MKLLTATEVWTIVFHRSNNWKAIISTIKFIKKDSSLKLEWMVLPVTIVYRDVVANQQMVGPLV